MGNSLLDKTLQTTVVNYQLEEASRSWLASLFEYNMFALSEKLRWTRMDAAVTHDCHHSSQVSSVDRIDG